MADSKREELILKIMHAADAGLISVIDRDRRIDNVRRSGNDIELDLIEREIDRVLADAPQATPTAAPTLASVLPSDVAASLPRLGARPRRLNLSRAIVLLFTVALMAAALTWVYRSMRAVMVVGGACASGGPYVPVQPCPDGSWMIGPAIPVMVLAAIIGTTLAVGVNAPAPIVVMWAALFGSLGWNFIDFGVNGEDLVAGWIVCGVVFWLMAAPAALFVVRSMLKGVLGSVAGSGAAVWWLGYAVVGGAAVWFGSWSWSQLA